jgi:mono/diheme cytochrome c family protein
LASATGGLLLVVSQLTFVSAQQPSRSGEAPSAATAAQASGDVDRGRYIVESVAMCAECHSPRDGHGVILKDNKFKGGPIPVNPPWTNNWANRAPRIAGLPGYTDEMVIKLLTQGAIGRNGLQLRAPMPRFRMDERDALAVAAYLRTQH